MKKFVCPACGYVHEGNEAPEKCPVCKVPGSKFTVMEEGKINFATEHTIGVQPDLDPEVLEGLRAHFTGECCEVGMYLAMSRQADREGYPEIAEAYKRFAFEKYWFPAPRPTSRCAWKPKPVLVPARWILPSAQKNSVTMPSMTLCMNWRKTKHVTEPVSPVC